MTLAPGDQIELRVTADAYLTIRYAGASLDFNPIHIDEQFAKQVGLPGRVLHGMWTMAQIARALTDAGGGPEALQSLSVQFRGAGRVGEEIVVSGVVRERQGELAIVSSQVTQAGRRIIRNAVAEVRIHSPRSGSTNSGADPEQPLRHS